MAETNCPNCQSSRKYFTKGSPTTSILRGSKAPKGHWYNATYICAQCGCRYSIDSSSGKAYIVKSKF